MFQPASPAGQSNGVSKRTPQSWNFGSSIYVYQWQNSTPEILKFLPGARGNTAPFAKITGPFTQLGDARSMAVDPQGYLYVPRATIMPPPAPPNAILVFAPYANGNVPPVRVITGNATLLQEGFIDKIDVDANGFVYAAIQGKIPFLGFGERILVFPPGVNGNFPPVVINPDILQPHFIGNVAVGPTSVYALGGTLVGPGPSITLFPHGSSGLVPPTCTIDKPISELPGNNFGFAASPSINSGGTGTVYAAVLPPVLPLEYQINTYNDCISKPVAILRGPNTGMQEVIGIATDRIGFLYVLDAGGIFGSASVRMWSPTNQEGDNFPDFILVGPSTGFTNGPGGVAAITIGPGSPLAPP